jgi:hypothetical protein
MIHQIRRMPTMVPITMPAMAPPSRPELEVEPVLVLASTRTVVVGCCRARRRVRPSGRVGVGAMMAVFVCPSSVGEWKDLTSGTRMGLDGGDGRKLGMWWRGNGRVLSISDPVVTSADQRASCEQATLISWMEDGKKVVVGGTVRS